MDGLSRSAAIFLQKTIYMSSYHIIDNWFEGSASTAYCTDKRSDFFDGYIVGLGRYINNTASAQRPPYRNLEIPLKFELDGDPEDPAKGFREIAPYYPGGMPLFREDLIKALIAAGVDNLQFFPALLVEPKTGREFTNYKLVNIVGFINILDKKRSKMMGIGDGIFPDHVAEARFYDPAADGTLMFRLNGGTGIVVHDRVRHFIEKYKIPNLTFYEETEWMG